MEILLHDRRRRLVGRVRVDPAARPIHVKATDARGVAHEAYLEWEHALDDAGQLRACVACGAQRLYRRKTLPRVTPFVLVLAAAGVVAGTLGYSSHPAVLAALVLLLLVDIAVLFLAQTRLVCYRCATEYGATRIARYHQSWDARIAAEPGSQPEPAEAESAVSAAATDADTQREGDRG